MAYSPSKSSAPPDPAVDRVERLRQLVESGQYRPSANDIAEAIIRSTIPPPREQH